MSRKDRFQGYRESRRKTYFRAFRFLGKVSYESQDFQGPVDLFQGFQGPLDTQIYIIYIIYIERV